MSSANSKSKPHQPRKRRVNCYAVRGFDDDGSIENIGILLKEVLQQMSPGQAKSLFDAYRGGRSIVLSMAQRDPSGSKVTDYRCAVRDTPLSAQFFHVTAPDAVDSILADGIRANSLGQIFVIADERFADIVAANQLFLRSFAIFEIDPKGITGTVGADDVAEITASRHRMIEHQQVIAPEFLTLVTRERETSDERVAAIYLPVYRAAGIEVDQDGRPKMVITSN
jgi:hypothetical protein